MRVACISHGSVIAFNRRPFDLLAADHGIDCTVIVPDRWRGDLPNPDLAPDPPRDAAVLPLRGRWTGDGSLFRLRGLGRALEHLAPDVILLDEEPWSLVALQVLRARAHTPIVVYSKQNIRKRLPPPFGIIRGATMRRARAAWAVGETTAEVLRATGWTGPVALVPHGVEVERFVPGREEARRAALGLDGVVVGYGGRLVPEKGITDLLDAAGRLATQPGLPWFSLLFVGAGPLEARVRHAAVSGPLAGRVRFLPAVPHHEAPAMYRLMDLFVLPSRTTRSWREQFGRALLEAAATGLPLVAADSGEIPHVVRQLTGGRIVPEGDVPALARAMEGLITDRGSREAMGRANLEVARARFSQQAVAGTMAGLLREAAD